MENKKGHTHIKIVVEGEFNNLHKVFSESGKFATPNIIDPDLINIEIVGSYAHLFAKIKAKMEKEKQS